MKNWIVKALQGIDLTINKGEYISIMGPSGSGKTTLLNMICGLDRPTSGTVIVDGVDLSSLNDIELSKFRCFKVGYVFQTFNLIPFLNALDNVMLPMVFAGLSIEERRRKATELLNMVGLGDRLYHKPDELSGGQQQRVALARALANDPSILLADEPTANLDLNTGFKIINLIRDLNIKRGITVFCATHDVKILGICDRIAWIRDGKIERIEPKRTIEITFEELFEKPQES